ncbi:MAG: hypothetical protein MR779_02575 [Tenericutes bacterium]|nr:hypothetical protein [Mycoplasmatota bacterium]
MKRKKELLVILSSLLVIVLSVSVAYFTTKILGTGKEISVESADLKVIFTSGSGTINGSNIEPGWTSGENTFTVKNESNGTYKYNIIIKDLVNTFVTEGFLQYKITSTDGGYTMSDFVDVPKSSTATDTVLAENISIAKGATHTYKIIINYNNSDNVDQSADMGKLLSGKIFITKAISPTLASKLLEDNPTISTRSDFSTPFTTNTVNTLYKATENGTDVYYFAGQDTESTPINNWVKFGKNSSNQDLYWRIIRTNSDGSIRLLFSGNGTNQNDAYIGVSEFNTNYNSPKYVGYMYGDTDATLEEARTNTNNSTIKTAIDNWYASNMISYTKYLSITAVYCNDRELASGEKYSATGSTFDYAAYTRLLTNETPTYDCTNDNDKFTVDASTGNGKLIYPIALMTADEIAYAGGVNGTTAPMWYYTNSSLESSTGTTIWWSLSPSDWDGYRAHSCIVYGSDDPGNLNGDDVSYYLNGVRPVVSLKSCIKYSTGNGTSETPYEIAETSSGC